MGLVLAISTAALRLWFSLETWLRKELGSRLGVGFACSLDHTDSVVARGLWFTLPMGLLGILVLADGVGCRLRFAPGSHGMLGWS
jgi:hypothetical protein